jgi:hypothetical protein
MVACRHQDIQQAHHASAFFMDCSNGRGSYYRLSMINPVKVSCKVLSNTHWPRPGQCWPTRTAAAEQLQNYARHLSLNEEIICQVIQWLPLASLQCIVLHCQVE